MKSARSSVRPLGSSGLAGQRLQSPQHPVARHTGTANNQNGVVATDGSENIRPAFAIQSSSDRLRTSRYCSQDYHVAHAIDPQEQLRQQRLQRDPALLDVPSVTAYRAPSGVGTRASLSSRRSRESVACVTSQPAMQKELSQILLAAHDP